MILWEGTPEFCQNSLNRLAKCLAACKSYKLASHNLYGVSECTHKQVRLAAYLASSYTTWFCAQQPYLCKQHYQKQYEYRTMLPSVTAWSIVACHVIPLPVAADQSRHEWDNVVSAHTSGTRLPLQAQVGQLVFANILAGALDA